MPLGQPFEKSKHREAGLKHKLKLYVLRLWIFRDTLILVVVNKIVVSVNVSPNYISFIDC